MSSSAQFHGAIWHRRTPRRDSDRQDHRRGRTQVAQPNCRKLGQTVRAAAPPPTMPEKDEDIDMASVTVESSPPPPYVPLPRTLVEGTADTVVLVGAGGGRFVVTHREARCSAVLAKHLDERPEDREISLSEIDDAVLARIVAYMEYKVLFTGKPCTIPDFPIDAEEARRVLIASSALDC
ncbi:Transcription elongation factor B (SIII), polypeptide 1 (15kDa, elongin C) [Sarracenia purpurea var. burkii]